MSSKKVSGIVTRYANYRDNDRMVNIMTDNGIIGAAGKRVQEAEQPPFKRRRAFCLRRIRIV